MENITWNEEGILASDVWAIPKSLEPMSAQEERARPGARRSRFWAACAACPTP
jgi:hypothetical protein